MLQNPCKTLGFKKNMFYKIPPGGGEVNHIQPVAYRYCSRISLADSGVTNRAPYIAALNVQITT